MHVCLFIDPSSIGRGISEKHRLRLRVVFDAAMMRGHLRTFESDIVAFDDASNADAVLSELANTVQAIYSVLDSFNRG